MRQPLLDDVLTQATLVEGEVQPRPSAPQPTQAKAAAALASWRPSARLEPIERYGRFEILGRIGRGGMAEILLARERSRAGGVRHLVIKRVLPEVRDFDEMLHMFLDEARVVMGLSHPNLCQIYEVGEQEGTWFIAMEWVNGITLHQLIRRAIDSGDVDYAVIARVISQCAEALHYAHTARDVEGRLMRLVHRDVSPHNVMIAYDGRVKLLDFGIAKSTTTTHKTEAGVVKGKVCYMAPEQWLTQPLDGRTDVFALGACLYEALSGRVLFKRDSQMEVMKAVLSGEVPKLSELLPEVPAALADIAHRALETRPESRFQTALEMSEALERFLAGSTEPVGATQVSSYARRLFHEEVQLGPLLERSLRGAQLARSGSLVLPPLPPALLAGAKSLAPLRPLPPPAFPLLLPPPVTPSGPAPAVPKSEVPTEAARLEVREVAALPSMAERAARIDSLPEPEGPPVSGTETRLAPRSLEVIELPPRPVARPLARTLPMRMVGGRYGVATLACLLGLVPLFLVLRPAMPTPRALAAQLPEPVAPRRGALPAPSFTLLPPTAPLSEPLTPEVTVPEKVRVVPPPRTGRLSINTRPWSSVYIGRRLLGSTPLADVPVPRGAVMLKLVDRDGRVHLRRLAPVKTRDRTVYYEF